MEESVLISLIIGGAQIVGSIIVLIATIINSKVGKLHDDKDRLRDETDRLKDKVKDQESLLNNMARQIYFLRIVEESVYNELAETNSGYKAKYIKTQIRKSVSKQTSVAYVDNDISKYIGGSKSFAPVPIHNDYIK